MNLQKPSLMKNPTLWLVVIIELLILITLFFIFQIPEYPGQVSEIGSRPWPLITAATVFIASLFLLRPQKPIEDSDSDDDDEDEDEELTADELSEQQQISSQEDETSARNPEGVKMLLIGLLFLFLVPIAWTYLGFYITFGAASLLLPVIFGQRNPLKLLTFAVLINATIYVIFVMLLRIPL